MFWLIINIIDTKTPNVGSKNSKWVWPKFSQGEEYEE